MTEIKTGSGDRVTVVEYVRYYLLYKSTNMAEYLCLCNIVYRINNFFIFYVTLYYACVQYHFKFGCVCHPVRVCMQINIYVPSSLQRKKIIKVQSYLPLCCLYAINLFNCSNPLGYVSIRWTQFKICFYINNYHLNRKNLVYSFCSL